MSQAPPVHELATYRTAAEWWDALGRVPMERIVFNPRPGTATEEDVLRLDSHEDRLCELIDGTLVEKAYCYMDSVIAARIAYLLSAFVTSCKLGLVSGPDGMLKMLAGRVRIPDVAFIAWSSLPGGRKPQQPIPELAPDLAVEVLSESNTSREMATKLREYFEAGTRLVWYVDPRTHSVDVYTSPQTVTRLTAQDRLKGEPVLDGFEVAVEDIFNV